MIELLAAAPGPARWQRMGACVGNGEGVVAIDWSEGSDVLQVNTSSRRHMRATMLLHHELKCTFNPAHGGAIQGLFAQAEMGACASRARELKI